jgi:catechol 2,3-dioxygenase-like lactoylglutathione lyase family enzyme
MPAIATLSAVTLDCPDPAALADFYRAVTGWDTLYSSDDYAYLGGAGEVRLGFQRAADHARPRWPGPDTQAHLDFGVPDLAEAEGRLLELGATVAAFQPGGDKWRVLLDPAGHPFCISTVT